MGTAALAERVRAGDRAAFAELYDDYADRIYAFCDALLRDRDEAADATHDAFVLVAQRIGQLRDPDRLTAWLFAIARHVCFRRLEQRRRVTPVDFEPDVLVLDDDPGDALSADEAAALVWAAAAGLNDRDRAVLVLNTREGLEGVELAAALGVQHSNPYSMLHRAKAQLERALGVLLVARLGRGDCQSLAEMLDGWDGVLTPLLRKRLGRHVEGCASCRATRMRANPLSVLAAAPLVRPSRADAMTSPRPRTVSMGELRDIASRRPDAEERWQRDGFPPPIDARRRRRRRALLLVAALSLGLALIPLATASGHPDRGSRRSVPRDANGGAHATPPAVGTTTTTVSRTRRGAVPTTMVPTTTPSGAVVVVVPGAPTTTTIPSNVQVSPATLHATVPPSGNPPTTRPPPSTTPPKVTTTSHPTGTTSTTIGDT